jgi:hypothetical protein
MDMAQFLSEQRRRKNPASLATTDEPNKKTDVAEHP